VYLPNCSVTGYRAFNRYFFAQIGKEAAIIDDRFNSGGDSPGYIIECLRRPLMNYWHMCEGRDTPAPMLSIFGPKVMIINEMTASCGECFAVDVSQGGNRSFDRQAHVGRLGWALHAA